MRLEKAIEIKLQWRKDGYPPPLADEMNADMVAIEALKRLNLWRECGNDIDTSPLPGETYE